MTSRNERTAEQRRAHLKDQATTALELLAGVAFVAAIVLLLMTSGLVPALILTGLLLLGASFAVSR